MQNTARDILAKWVIEKGLTYQRAAEILSEARGAPVTCAQVFYWIKGRRPRGSKVKRSVVPMRRSTAAFIERTLRGLQ